MVYCGFFSILTKLQILGLVKRLVSELSAIIRLQAKGFLSLQVHWHDGPVLGVVLAAGQQCCPHGVGAPGDHGVVAAGQQRQVEDGGLGVNYLDPLVVEGLAGPNKKLKKLG